MIFSTRELFLAAATSAGVLVGSMGMASAVPQSHIFSTIGGGVESETFGFAQFNSALGTLNSVTITLPSYTMTNYANASIMGGLIGDSVSVSLNGDVQVVGPTGVMFGGSVSASISCTVSTGDSCNDDDFGTQASGFLDPNTITLTLPGDLSPFIGAGTVDITVDITNYFSEIVASLIGGSNANTAESYTEMEFAPQIDVEYNYTAAVETPEPASLALFATGMGLMGLVRRRRRG